MASTSKCPSPTKQVRSGLSSAVWKYFDRSKCNQFAVCQVCKVTLKTGGGSTKTLHGHLSAKHKITLLKRKNETEDDGDGSVPQLQQKAEQISINTMNRYLLLAGDDRSMAATVARLTTCDGLSFRVIVKSSDMRRLMLSAGFSNFPRSQTALKNIVLKHAQKLRAVVSAEFQQLLKKGKRFSLTFDEWTSVRNRRYMCVNVHADGPKYWSLGLVRVWGSMPAEKCIELLRGRLAAFRLNLDTDIVAVCTDGASVMCRVGRLLSAEHQQCIVHGIHLAVQDVLYKGPGLRGSPSAADDEGNSESDSEGDSGTLTDDMELVPGKAGSSSSKDHTNEKSQEVQEGATVTELTDECDAEDEYFQVQEDTDTSYDLLSELSSEYRETVFKVRKTVKLFRKSPTKNDSVLQKYVVAEHKHEMSLILDCRTRWNSLLAMLSRFWDLRHCIQKAMIDMKATPAQQFTDAEFTIVEDLKCSLEPVALVVEALSRGDINLISAEAALQFCVINLRKQQSELAKTLAFQLHSRISDRCAKHLDVLRFLHSRAEGSSEFSSGITSAEIKKFILSLILRLDKPTQVTLTQLTQAAATTSSTTEDNSGIQTG
jgi:hypothetical protein